jgi:hypothetical protein
VPIPIMITFAMRRAMVVMVVVTMPTVATAIRDE